jgi:pyridoxal phosphate enzyme (YggS family)
LADKGYEINSMNERMQTGTAERLAQIRVKMDEACAVSKRASGCAKLVAVSKTFPVEAVRLFLQAGQRTFGENRVQEALGKWPQLRAEFSNIELHLIGPLQTNKIREAVALFDVIETVDREKLAAGLAMEIERTGRAPQLFVQVNTGEEPQKAGIAPQDCVSFVKRCVEIHKLKIEGLMCIPPFGEPAGPHFAFLNKLAREAGVKGLSMGMSSDFEEAIWCGATHVRVGSALFGVRT